MSNSYPDVFKKNCAGSFVCDTPPRGCNINSSKVVRSNKKSNKNVSSESVMVESESIPDRSGDVTTIHCLPYKAPSRVISDNNVNFKTLNAHSWSNQRGYGNIITATNDTCNNVHGKVKPWNRIEALPKPFFTNADTKMAWNNATPSKK